MGFLEKWLESLDYEYEILSTCTRFNSPHSKCRICMDVCEENAIHLDKNKPAISTDKCTECGKCISACPVQAVAGIYPRRSFIDKKLAVTEGFPPTAKELVVLHAKGITEIVAQSETLLNSWQEPIDEANQMLIQLEKEPYKVNVAEVKQKEESYTRRELFSFWKKESTSFLKLAIPAKWRFNHDDFNLAKHYPEYQFFHITVDVNKCTVCNACQKLCGQNCFDIQKEVFQISPQDCNACQICADICPEHAIVIENKISRKLEEPISLTVYNNTCSTCDRSFEALTPDENKCIICKKRELFIKN